MSQNLSVCTHFAVSQEFFSYFLANIEHCDARVRRPDGLSDGRTGGKDTVSTRSTICSTAVLCTVLGKQVAAAALCWRHLGGGTAHTGTIRVFSPSNCTL